MDSPDIFINGKQYNGTRYESFNKIEKNKFQGLIEINLPQNTPEKFNLKLNTNKILNVKGQWTVTTQVK